LYLRYHNDCNISQMIGDNEWLIGVHTQKHYPFFIISEVLIIIETFITIIYHQLNRVLDAQMKDEEREELVTATVKEALLGCYYDWNTRVNDNTPISTKEEMLREYAGMLVVVCSKFSARDLLSESLCDRILGCAKEMQAIADVHKHVAYEWEDTTKANEIFKELYQFYKDFDRLYNEEMT
jgi:hypothetical protein